MTVLGRSSKAAVKSVFQVFPSFDVALQLEMRKWTLSWQDLVRTMFPTDHFLKNSRDQMLLSES